MKQFMLTISTTNAGVDPDDDGGFALRELIEHVAEQVAEGYRKGNVLDANGNDVGAWVLT